MNNYTCIFCGDQHVIGYICPKFIDLFATITKPTPPVSAPTPVAPVVTVPAPVAASRVNNAMSNINADGNIPMCPIHKQPMDRLTKKSTPYHSYKGKNCSGEGWWGDPKPQQ